MRYIGMPVLLALSSLGVAPAAATPATPTQLVRTLYADEASGRLGDPLWWRYLSKRTHALKSRIEALYHGEEPAFLDHDWLCQCQDSEGMRVVGITTVSKSPARQTLRVRFINGTDRDSVRIVLVNEHGWKIDDIIDRHGQHYAAVLAHDIAAKR